MQKILVIEDEEAIRTNILELLEVENFEGIGAENGRRGVQLAHEHHPDLIICDVMMPELDGFGVLTALRQDPTMAAIPFIFLTAKSNKTDIRQGMELGADDYLTKPCTPAELMEAIAARLTRQLIVTQLQQRVQDLEQLHTQKDDFLSEASHDLRAPLANIKTAIYLLKVTDSVELRSRYLDLLDAECDREMALLNDLLDLQRLEANVYDLSPQPLMLQTWIPVIVEPFESRVQSLQQTLTVKVAAKLPPLVSDPKSLGRILTELLNNACKYTIAGGSIALNLELTQPSTTLNAASNFVFTITNQGDIAAAALPHVFEKFYRVQNAVIGHQKGTGLGLALVQKLVGQLGGTIAVSSDDGWTTFTVALPTRLREQA